MIDKLLTFFKKNTTDEIKGSESMRTNWVEITDTDAIERIIHRSNRKPQFIFKHSTRCPISSHAYTEVSSVTDDIADEVDINYVDVISQREVSREIARRLDIEHESPQILLVENNKVVWDASHYDIEGEIILEKARASVEALSL